MKIQIRNSCFETNSSSMHAIVITSKPVKNEYLKYHSIEFNVSEFGWEHITYYDTNSKASYIWTSIVNRFLIQVNDEGTHKSYDGKDIQNYHYELDVKNPEYIKRKKVIKNACIHAGIENDSIRFQEDFSKIKYGKGAYGIETGYIDHDPGLGFVDEIIFNEDRLIRFLFNNNSTITTWNDNEWEIDEKIDEELHNKYWDIENEEYKDGYWEEEEWAHFKNFIPEDEIEWKYLKSN